MTGKSNRPGCMLLILFVILFWAGFFWVAYEFITHLNNEQIDGLLR